VDLPSGKYSIEVTSIIDGSKRFSGVRENKGGTLNFDMDNMDIMKDFAIKILSL